jgi:NAD(P)-dependent dehydrogenase (short-subunit alcohol dehydrogenase family)
MRLQDKVVVITGAGHGLGRESARLFASEGAKVVVTDIVDTHVKTLADEIKGSGGQAVAAKADVTSEDDMLAAVRTAVESFGRLDVMFCNAGIPEVGFGTVEFVDTTLENWNRVIGVNLTGVFLGAKAAAKQFLAQGGGGTIVVTTSAASLVAYPGFRSYVAAKARAGTVHRPRSLRDPGERAVPIPRHVRELPWDGRGRAAREVIRGDDGGRVGPRARADAAQDRTAANAA